MSKIYFTITGMNYYYGTDVVEKGDEVKLVKEPDNKYDKEAILVCLEGLGDVGHVANSPYTVLGESYSAGRLYDKIGETAEGTVQYVLPNGVLCFIEVEDTEAGA
jgi:hypothetical protein